MLVLPIDGKRLIHFHVLAGLDAAAAEHALAGVIAVKRVGVVNFIGLGLERDILVLHLQQFCGVVDGAVAVVVVADGAIEEMVFKDAIEGLALGGGGRWRVGDNGHRVTDHRRAGAHQFSIHLHHAGVAGLNGAELWVIADLGQLNFCAVNVVDKTLASFGLNHGAVDRYANHIHLRVQGACYFSSSANLRFIQSISACWPATIVLESAWISGSLMEAWSTMRMAPAWWGIIDLRNCLSDTAVCLRMSTQDTINRITPAAAMPALSFLLGYMALMRAISMIT